MRAKAQRSSAVNRIGSALRGLVAGSRDDATRAPALSAVGRNASSAGSGALAGSGPLSHRARLALAALLAAALAAMTYVFLAVGSAAPPASAAAAVCPNAVFRTGPSAHLPDCRAYELVTPRNTGGRTPMPAQHIFGLAVNNLDGFSAPAANPDGSSYLFGTFGPIPGGEGNGWFNEYRAERTPQGWQTADVTPTAEQARYMGPGGHTADQRYIFQRVSGEGSSRELDAGTGVGTSWLRRPDGSFQLIGEGTIPASPDTDGIDNGTVDDPGAVGRYISPGAEHILFEPWPAPGTPGVQLLPNAPAAPIHAVYDRTPQGLKLASILPGEVVPSTHSRLRGFSADGSVVLFSNQEDPSSSQFNDSGVAFAGSLYARIDNDHTLKVADPDELPSGSTLACTAGPASAGTKSFQWLRNGAPIAGETGSTYTTQAADEGTVVQCQVFALNANAGATQVPSAGPVVGPAPATTPPRFSATSTISPPTPSGTLTVGGPGGQTLTCLLNPSSWRGSPSFSYQWYRNGVALSGNGADTDTYTVQAADLASPAVFQCAVTGTNAGGAAVKVSENRATDPAPSGPSAPVAAATYDGWELIAAAGVTDHGETAFYAHFGNIFSVDLASGQPTVLADSGDARPVIISRDGSHLFFLSWRQLDGPAGIAGQPNLYVSDGSTTRFIATVQESELPSTTGTEDAFGNWSIFGETNSARAKVAENGFEASLKVPTRVTADGSVFVFVTKAQLTAYNNNGKREIYRYETGSDSLECISCHPSGTPASADAGLRSRIFLDTANPAPNNIFNNLSEDGNSVIFDSGDDLLPEDADGKLDVYQWRNGVLSLISSGDSAQNETFMGATPDGETIFLRSAEALVTDSQEPGVPGIYAARVNGGFLDESAVTEPCAGDACQGPPAPPPAVQTAGTSTFSGPGNPTAKHRKRGCKQIKNRRKRKRCIRKRRENRRHAARHLGGSR